MPLGAQTILQGLVEDCKACSKPCFSLFFQIWGRQQNVQPIQTRAFCHTVTFISVISWREVLWDWRTTAKKVPKFCHCFHGRSSQNIATLISGLTYSKIYGVRGFTVYMSQGFYLVILWNPLWMFIHQKHHISIFHRSLDPCPGFVRVLSGK